MAQFESLLVQVIIRSLDSGQRTTDRIIDYSRANDRRWLSRASVWALNNRHSVTTAPLFERN